MLPTYSFFRASTLVARCEPSRPASWGWNSIVGESRPQLSGHAAVDPHATDSDGIRLADECLPQLCQTIERGGRQRVFLDRGERVLTARDRRALVSGAASKQNGVDRRSVRPRFGAEGMKQQKPGRGCAAGTSGCVQGC